MSKQGLGCADWCSNRVEQSCVGVPEPVPVRTGQFKSLAHRLELAIEQIAPTGRGTVCAENTKADRAAPVVFTAARISTHFGPRGMRRLLRLFFGSSKYLHQFIVVEDDGGLLKKIAAYHQFYAVRAGVERVRAASDPGGEGKGGVVAYAGRGQEPEDDLPCGQADNASGDEESHACRRDCWKRASVCCRRHLRANA